MKIEITLDTPLPTNWTNFMCEASNKSALFSLLADQLKTINPFKVTVFVTKDNIVVSDSPGGSSPDLSPSCHEEADTRLILYASAYKDSVIIKTNDTDVLVIATAFYYDLNLPEVWLELGTGNSRLFAVHDLAEALGPTLCKALLFFHAFTGFDTVSSFHGVGKTTAWNVFITHKFTTKCLSYHVFLRFNLPVELF